VDAATKAHIEECKTEMHNHIERRFDNHKLTEEQMEAIAERAANKALAKITDLAYREVGKSVVSKLFYITGVVSVALYLYLQSKGFIK